MAIPLRDRCVKYIVRADLRDMRARMAAVARKIKAANGDAYVTHVSVTRLHPHAMHQDWEVRICGSKRAIEPIKRSLKLKKRGR